MSTLSCNYWRSLLPRFNLPWFTSPRKWWSSMEYGYTLGALPQSWEFHQKKPFQSSILAKGVRNSAPEAVLIRPKLCSQILILRRNLIAARHMSINALRTDTASNTPIWRTVPHGSQSCDIATRSASIGYRRESKLLEPKTWCLAIRELNYLLDNVSTAEFRIR